MSEPTGALRNYCELLFVGWTTSTDHLLARDANGNAVAYVQEPAGGVSDGELRRRVELLHLRARGNGNGNG